MLLSDILLYPLTSYIAEVSLVAVTIGFTSTRSPVRWLVLPVLIIPVYLLVTTSLQRCGVTIQATTYGGGAVAYLMQYVEVGFLSRWSFESYGPEEYSEAVAKKEIRRQDSFWQRLRFGYYATFSYRCCGTPFEVKNVAPFFAKDPKRVPSKIQFLQSTLMKFIGCCIFMDALTLAVNPEKSAILYSDRRIPFFARLGEIDGEEVGVRIVSTVMFWVASYCMLEILQVVPAFIAVSLGLSEPSWWRPFFYPVSSSYTVRSFWG